MMSLRSNSLGGSGGHNEITMNDMGGAETLYVKAQKDETHEVGHDRKDTLYFARYPDTVQEPGSLADELFLGGNVLNY